MKRAVIILTLLASTGTVLYQMNTNDPLAAKKQGSSPAALPEPSPMLKFQKPAKSAIGNPDAWSLKPFVPLGKMLSLKDMFKPVYTLILKDRVHILQRSDRPNQGWEFQGILMRDNHPQALLYNSGTSRLKAARVGDVIDEQLVVHAIGAASVTLEAKDDKKPQLFELRLFNKQKISAAAERFEKRREQGVSPSVRNQKDRTQRNTNDAARRRNNDATQSNRNVPAQSRNNASPKGNRNVPNQRNPR